MRTRRYYIAKWDAVLQKSHGASDEKNARRAAQRRDASAVGDLAEKQKKSEAPKCFALADDRLRAGNLHGGSSLC